MSIKTEISFDRNVLTQISRAQQEPQWMLDSRLSALERVSKLPLPRVEKTNIEKWNFTQFNPYQAEEPIADLDVLSHEVTGFLLTKTDSNVMIQKNASVIYRSMKDELKEQGVIFTDIATAMREYEELIKPYYMTKGITQDEHRLAALHAALTSGGVFLYVPKNIEIEVPLQSLFWLSGQDASMSPHILVVTEANSRVDFVASFLGEDGAAFNNCMFEVFVGENSSVRISTMNHLSSSTVDVTYKRSLVDRGGQLEWISGELSEGHVISYHKVHLNGDGSGFDSKSVAVGVNDLRSNLTSEVHHWGKHTSSDIHARAVMKDSASNIINSITKIERGAMKSDGQQSSKVLMLNEKSRGDANPILLIDENDVTAGHAASVGRVDPLQIFYLMSRGIRREKAEKLIIDGFLDTVISQIPSEPFQKFIHRLIGRKF